MKWKFWRKGNPLAHLDPHTLAYVMVQKMVEREFPFNKWRDEEDPIPERADAWVEVCVNIYQLTIFLDFLERKFGADVAGIVKSHLIALMNKGPRGAVVDGFFGAVQIGRATPEREQFFAHDPAIPVDCNVAKAFLALAAETQAEKDAVYPLLGKSLGLGRISAEAAFADLVESIEFRPETIVGLRKPQDISVNWSEVCGCFERQLQRRHMNALFPVERRKVSTADVIEARAKDWADVRQLQTHIDGVFAEVTSLPKQTTLNEALRHREAIELLIVRAAEIGAIANQQRDALRHVYDSIVYTLRESCPPEHRAELEGALADSESYQRTWANQFLAQMKRSDTPILGGEIVPSLLTEDVETVRVVASTLEEAVRKETYDLAVALVADVLKEGYTVAQAEQKLQALRNSA